MLIMILLTLLINQPDGRVSLVRTNQQLDHNAALDLPQFSRLMPYAVTMRSNNGQAIRTVGISFDVIAANGDRQSFADIYDMPQGSSVVHRGDSTSFWPGGRLSTKSSGHPLVSTLPDSQMLLIETAKSVTVNVTYLEFEDGTVVDLGAGRFVTLYRQRRKGNSK